MHARLHVDAAQVGVHRALRDEELGGDALAPVTLYANGKSVGKGRLVDLNGTLGVQVVSLGKVGE